jgi:hypothetical protein
VTLMHGARLVLWVVLASCGESTEEPQCPGTVPCRPGDECAGFESDFECTKDGFWQCVPSGRVFDPCVRPDAGIDALLDAIDAQ